MKQKSWMKKYGIHVGICAVIIAVAFGINREIDIDRSHVYIVSEPIYTLLKEVTEVKVEENSYVLSGWGFDTNIYNENSKCELILQDTETGEALWPKMEKNPAPVQIAERYTDGADYAGASFKGTLKKSKLDADRVYEILIRYTTDYVDENGTEQQYVRTVTTDEFLYQGQMTEYNPKTFAAPEIAGTELEKELEGARLFHYFPEGMWIYYDEEGIYYILEKNNLNIGENIVCPVHWFVKNENDLPEERQKYGFGNSDFKVIGNAKVETEKYLAVSIEIPSDKMVFLETGIHCDGEWKCKTMKQWEG